jgi:hypothetical protein
MTTIDQQLLYEWCGRIYSRDGQSAVFDFILESYPNQPWDNCEPCETLSPRTEETKPSCLVCGSLIKN